METVADEIVEPVAAEPVPKGNSSSLITVVIAALVTAAVVLYIKRR